MKTSVALLLLSCGSRAVVAPQIQRSEDIFIKSYNANQFEAAAGAVSPNPAMKRMLTQMLSETRPLLGEFSFEAERAHVPSSPGFRLVGEDPTGSHALGGHFEKYPGAFIFEIKEEAGSFKIVGLQVCYDGPQSVIDPVLARVAHDTAEMISPKKR